MVYVAEQSMYEVTCDGYLTGTSVKVVKTSASGALNLCEVEVFGVPTPPG